MSEVTPADALLLAINVLRDSAESRHMPSGIALDASVCDLHARAADVLQISLADLQDLEDSGRPGHQAPPR